MKNILLCLILLATNSNMNTASASTTDYKTSKKACIPIACIVILITFFISRLGPTKGCMDTKIRLETILEQNITHGDFAAEIERLELTERDKFALFNILETLTDHAGEDDVTLAISDSEPLKEIIQAHAQERRQSRAAFFGPKHEQRHLRKR